MKPKVLSIENFFRMSGLASSPAGQLVANLEEAIQKMIVQLAEETKVDLESFIQSIELLEETGEKPKPQDYQNIFFSKWLSANNQSFQKTFLQHLNENDEATLKIKEYIEGMGQKAVSAKNGFCISLQQIPECKKCYYREICNCKEKH